MKSKKDLPLTDKGVMPYKHELTKRARINRKNPTPAEKLLWGKVLSNKQLQGYKFLRQKPLLYFILDFYCSEILLGIEVDGDSHDEKEEYDKERTMLLEQTGIKILRYTNDDVLNNIDGVHKDLMQKSLDRKTGIIKKQSKQKRG